MKNLKKTTASVVSILAVILVTYSCRKEDEPKVPELTTLAVSQIATDFAHSGGNVINDGGVPITSRGLVWAKTPNPTLESNDGFTVNGSGLGVFSAVIDGLSANTTYYVRAYSTNIAGNGYGNQQDFSTIAAIPELTTTPVTELSARSAKSGGTLKSDGGAPISARGVCWSYNPDPTIADFKTNDGEGTGSFVSNLTGLTENTTYYLRAYATNSAGTAYGNSFSFVTNQIVAPVLTTSEITLITHSSAEAGGNIISNGGSEILAKGVCWSTSPNPTITGNKTIDQSATLEFISHLTDLNPNTKYYVRAYATNSKGTGYGSETTFTTLAQPPAAVTLAAASIMGNSATLQSRVNPNNSLTEVSFEYGATASYGQTVTTSISPITGHTDIHINTGIHYLIPGTTYHFRVKAVNSAGITFGEDMTFTTLNIPMVSTTTVTSVTVNSAITGGVVISDGGASSLYSRGVCWNTSGNPTVSDSKTFDGSSTGSFVSTLNGLLPNTVYYVRAYASSYVGTAYGNQLTFTTD